MAAAAILKIAFFGHNSSTDCPISAKFCMRKQNSMSILAAWQKLQIFEIQDGGRPPFWKWLNRHISVKNRPILMKLGTLHQILNLMTVKWRKIKIFKIQDGGGRHLENRFSGHYSSTDCPISAKFCMNKQNGMLLRATQQKMQIFKIQDGGQSPLWKRQIAISQWKIIQFRWNSVHYSKCQTRLQSRDQKLNVLKFKMAATAILKIVISPYLRETVIGFWQNLVYNSIKPNEVFKSAIAVS